MHVSVSQRTAASRTAKTPEDLLAHVPLEGSILQSVLIEKAKSAPGLRLQIILTKLRVNQSCENSARRAMVASGVELASELFAISYEVAVHRPAYDHPGFDEMAQMLTLEAKCDPGYAMQLARSISSPVLQAYSIATVSKF